MKMIFKKSCIFIVVADIVEGKES